MLHRFIWCALSIAGVLFLPASAQPQDSTLNTLMATYFEAATPEALSAAIENLVQSGVSADQVAGRLRQGKPYATDAPMGWSVLYFEGLDGRVRPYHVYVPTTYDPNVCYPVLFDLHGAVSTHPQPVEYLEQRRRLWEPEAEEYGWILVVPHGDRMASWFSADGNANIQGELSVVKHLYNVDENKVFVSGFSDGGSGAFWQAFHDPTPWAGIISFHGHPAIGGYGPYQSYPRNLLNRPIRATTGEQDELYPPSNVAPYMELLHAAGVTLDWIVYPGGHEVQFLTTEAPFTVEFITDTRRDPTASEVVWETSNLAVGRCDWVRIDEIADGGNNEEFPDLNLAEVPEQIVFGASLAYHGGTLFTVAGLEVGSAAHLMGIKNEDQIVRIDELPVLTQTDIGYAMIGKAPGDPVEVELIRNGETLILSGEIPPAELIYRRDVPTGSIRVSANGNEIDVSVSHVGRYTLFVSSRQFDLSQPIQVITNGQTSYSAMIAPDVRFMLEQAAEDFDREMVYEAKIEIAVPASDS